MFKPTQRVRAAGSLLRFGTVEAHIGDDVYVVWDGERQALKLRTDEIEPATPEDERKAGEGARRFLGAIFGKP